MPARAHDALASTLGVDVSRLDFLADLDESSIARFDTILRSALKRDAAALDAGVEEALRFVPALLRGQARKMLFGGGR